MKKAMVLTAMAALLSAPMALMAQEAGSKEAAAKPADHFYKLNFVVEELNEAGKVTNARNFQTTIDTVGRTAFGGPATQQIRTGARIPVATNGNEWQYMDVGVDLDVVGPQEIGDKVGFNLSANISSLANPQSGTSDPLSHPVVRQNKWSSNVLIPIGKPIVVYSADDLDSKGKMQVEVTATKIE